MAIENEIFAAASYIRLRQVRKDISEYVKDKTVITRVDDYLHTVMDDLYEYLFKQGYPVHILDED